VRIDNITNNITIRENVTDDIKYYYGDRGLNDLNIGLTDLMYNYRTGIITGKSHSLTKFFDKARRYRYKIKVCICFNNFNTYISLQRKKNDKGYIYFEAQSVGVP
jgi:hypothetical protein